MHFGIYGGSPRAAARSIRRIGGRGCRAPMAAPSSSTIGPRAQPSDSIRVPPCSRPRACNRVSRFSVRTRSRANPESQSAPQTTRLRPRPTPVDRRLRPRASSSGVPRGGGLQPACSSTRGSPRSRKPAFWFVYLRGSGLGGSHRPQNRPGTRAVRPGRHRRRNHDMPTWCVRSPGGRPRGRPRRVPTPATAVPDGADISQAAPDTRPATLGGLVMPLAAL